MSAPAACNTRLNGCEVCAQCARPAPVAGEVAITARWDGAERDGVAVAECLDLVHNASVTRPPEHGGTETHASVSRRCAAWVLGGLLVVVLGAAMRLMGPQT